MAEVFTSLKAFDASLKDNHYHAKPIYHDDECIQHAYELVNFYKFHVQSVETLIHRYEDIERRYGESEDSRKALATKLHNTECELKIAKTELEECKKELRKEKDSHQKTKDMLEHEKLEHQRTRDKLKVSEDQLQTTTSQLKQTTDKFQRAIIDLRDANTELTKVKDMLAKTQDDLAKTKNELCKARENYASADKRAEDNRRQLDEAIRNEKAANKRAREANDRADKLEEERDILNKEVDNLKKALENANASNNDSCTGLHVIRKPNRTCDNVYIDAIIYGGKAFDDKKTIDIFLQLLKAKTVFEVHNRLFPEDPWHVNLKTLTVVYSVDGKPFQYLVGNEWEKVRFTY